MRHSPARRLPIAALMATSLLMPTPHAARAGEGGGFLRALTAPIRAAHREPPATCQDPGLEQLTREIDWLRRRMDATGSIVAQHPDVWGQNRLIRHRAEYDELLRAQLGGFRDLANAHLRRSDQAFLGMALALAPATTTGRPGTTRPTEISASVTNLISNPVDGAAGEAVITRTPPFTATSRPFADFGLDDAAAVSLEPTVHLDHLSRYVNHLQSLRRINEGDDVADSPGYSLNLVRIPVSITPGQRTQAGHGAEITITVQPQLGGDLLPTTFRNLVINDLVDALAPVITHAVNVPAVRAAAAAECAGNSEAAPTITAVALRGLASRSVSVPSVKSRRARMPFPPEQLVEVLGQRQVGLLLRAVIEALGTHPASDSCIDHATVRGLLGEELAAAADFLAQPRQQQAWDELPGWNLAELVRSRRAGELELRRRSFFAALGIDEGAAPAVDLIEPVPLDMAGGPLPSGLDAGPLPDTACQGPCSNALPPCSICRTTTAVLAWAILVESALLDARLAADIRESGAARGQAVCVCAGPYFGPDPSPEARAAFDDYVRRRWPLRVFALDPVTEEQNVADEYSQRREMQIAMAIAFASGRSSGQALTRYARRLETDLATISLNKTAVGFTHGADTFGWRFYPRIQPPPTRGTVATLTDTLCGTSTHRDLAARRLEGGQRECSAIIVMPSFVPLVSFDVRTSWFSLTHPGDTEQSLRETLLLSRSLQSIQQQARRCLQKPGCYQPGVLAGVQQTIEMLDRRMPMQSMLAQIPYENEAAGFELFNTGITDLAPELIGWYGGPGIDPTGTTTLFLLGKGFSVHDTRVIAGGRPVKAELVSRQLLRVEIPPGVMTTKPTIGVCQAGSGPRAAAVRQRPSVRLASDAEPLPTPGPTSRSPADKLAPADRPTLRLSLPTLGGGATGDAAGMAIGAADACCEMAGGIDCHAREVVDIHLATPYGVSGQLLIPVVGRVASAAGRCDLAFSAAPVIRLTATKTKADTWRVNEYYEAAGDTIRIAVPEVFAPPARAALDFVLRDPATGATAGTFTIPAPPFDARTQEYVLAGGDLRNFVGDTSRPATDKTLRGAVKPYLDSLGTGTTADDKPVINRDLALTANLVTETKTIPIDGTVTVEVRRADQPLDQAPEPAAKTTPD